MLELAWSPPEWERIPDVFCRDAFLAVCYEESSSVQVYNVTKYFDENTRVDTICASCEVEDQSRVRSVLWHPEFPVLAVSCLLFVEECAFALGD